MTNHESFRITVTFIATEDESAPNWDAAVMYADIREAVRNAGYDADLTVKVERQRSDWIEVHPNADEDA